MALIDPIKEQFKEKNGVYYLTEPYNSIEDTYLKVREAEGRIYNDEQLEYLPEVDSSHQYYAEWMTRKHSMQMLTSYLDSRSKNKTLLELGCGNGWLTNKFAELGLSEVIGMDVNIKELEQAARVFSGRKNLLFVFGNVFSLPNCMGLSEMGNGYDYIILSSVISYFKNLKTLIDTLLTRLKADGEIHIIDSPFYKDKIAAHERSVNYYIKLGFPEMSGLYHHHSIDDMMEYNYSRLYNPKTLTKIFKRKLGFAQSPFPWIKLTR